MRLRAIYGVVFCSLGISSQAATIQETIIYPDAPVPLASFGKTMAKSGQTVVVGASSRNIPAAYYGSAYVFDMETGTQTYELLPEDPVAHTYFGNDVAVEGSTALVGAYRATGSTRDSGAAYVFDLETGAQKFKLTSDEALGYDNFGVSVALAGNTALVGANEVWDGADGYSAGAVFLFDTTTGEQTGVLRQNDIDPYDRFGSDIVTYGNYALIGTSGHDIAGQFAGAAYLFDIETQTQLVKITPDDAEENSYFGNSLALSDRYAVIGAQRADLGGHDRGAAYIFDFLTGEQIKLTAPDGEDQDFFGSSVAIFGDVVLVGARYDSHFSPSSVGSVYAFDVMGNVLGKLYPSAAISGDSYGAKILFDLDAILIGAPGDRTNGSKSGAVYAYTRAADAAPQALSSAAPLNASSLLSLFTPIPSPAAVPLPASLWLLGAGVLGLSIRTRGLRAR